MSSSRGKAGIGFLLRRERYPVPEETTAVSGPKKFKVGSPLISHQIALLDLYL
jgi:hypothetical protein